MSSDRLSFGMNTLRRMQHIAKFRDISLTAIDFQESTTTVVMSLIHVESWFRHKIFKRIGDKIIGITEAGKIYLEYVDAILAAQDTFDSKMFRITGRISMNADTAENLGSIQTMRCPNCGAPIDIDMYKCEYCDSLLVVKRETF